MGLRLVAVRILQEDARMQALVAPGERSQLGRTVRSSGTGGDRGRELAAAAKRRLGEEVRSSKLVEDPDGEILVVA